MAQVKVLIATVCIYALVPLSAHACGKLSLGATNISETWDQNPELRPEEFQVFRSDTSKSCSYYVTFTAGQSNSHSHRFLRQGGHRLGYQLYRAPFRDLGQMLRSYPGAVQSGNVVLGSFAPGQRINQIKHTYFFGPTFESNPLHFPPGGIYSDTFLISVYQGNPRSNTPPDATMQVFVHEFVPGMIELSLVPSGSEFQIGDRVVNMDFGVLKTGDSRDFDLRVITNSGYRVYFSSANGGILKHVDKQVETTVPYTVIVDSVTKDLSRSKGAPTEVARAARHFEPQNAVDHVRVTIGDVQHKVAGRYQDAITIFATTSE